jgi:hypothetical protein
VFYIRELITTMTTALDEGDDEEFYYNMGVLLFIVQDFKKVEMLLA